MTESDHRDSGVNSQPSGFVGLRMKILISFGMLFIITLIGIGLTKAYGLPFSGFDGEFNNQQALRFGQLGLLADLKKGQLLAWLDERSRDLRLASQAPTIESQATRLDELLHREIGRGLSGDRLWASMQTSDLYSEVQAQLRRMRDAYGDFETVSIADHHFGLVMVSSDTTLVGWSIIDRDYYKSLRVAGEVHVTDIKRDSVTGKPRLLFSSLIFGPATGSGEPREAVAVMTLAIDPDKVLRPILQTGEGLGRTGEALLINSDTRILASLKHPLTDGSMARPLEYQIEAEPARFASRGEEGIIRARDYRGVAVLAAYRHLRLSTEIGWGLVVKQDEQEIFADLREEISYVVGISILGTLLSLILIALTTNWLTRPIRNLVTTANAVTDGDLSARATVTSADEVGRLGATFNTMIQRIQSWHQELGEEVRLRTKELSTEREHLAVTLRSIGDGVIATDLAGNITFMNPIAERMTGWTLSEAEGKSIEDVFEIVNEDTGEKADNPVVRVLSEGVIVGLANHTSLIAKDGTVQPIDDSGAPIKGESGEILGSILVFHDISERRQAESRIEHLNSVLLAVRNVNQLITREKEPHKLAQKACQCLVETRGFFFAFMVLGGRESGSTFACQAGLDESFESLAEKFDRGEWPNCCLRARDVETVAILRDSSECGDCPHVVLDFDAGILSTKLTHEDDSFGYLVAAIPKALVDDPDEIALFEEVAGDIAFALHSIAQQERGQEAVRKEKEVADKFKLSIANMMDAYALHGGIFDENGRMIDYRFVDWNPAAEKITGVKAVDIVGKRVLELFPNVIERGLMDRYAEVMATGKPAHIEDFYYEGDDLNMAFDISCFRVDHRHFVCTFRDITDRQQAEDALAKERERLAVTLSSIGDAVIASDIEGNVVLFNKMAEQLTEYKESEAVGQPLGAVFRIIDAETRQDMDSPVTRVVQTGKVIGFTRQTLLIAKDGTERSIDDSGAPIRDPEGRTIGVVLVFRDITDTKRLQELAVRAQRLETAGRIAGQVAHDFNNLLAPLMAYPSFIKEALPEGDDARDFVDKIENAAEQIAEINQQLLTLGRRGHYTVAPFSLNDTVRQVVKQLSPLPSTLAVEVELAENLMPVKGGASQVFRAIANIMANARDAMQDIGRLSVKTENFYLDNMVGVYGPIPMGEYVKLTVSDTGSGLQDDLMSRIFEPFFTTKTTDRRRGSGLGLSIVHAVMEDHRGHIDLYSSPGEGTSFFLYFPASRESILIDPGDDHIVGGDEKVLVVDDDPFQRDVTVTLLKKLGYDASAVECGEAAVNLLKESSCDLVILDMIMPGGIDGAEAYRQILRLHPDQKSIIVSGYAESDRVQETLNLGAGVFVRKPLTIKSLAHAVRKELDRVQSAS